MMDRIWQEAPARHPRNNAAEPALAPTPQMSSRAIDAVLRHRAARLGYCPLAAGRRLESTRAEAQKTAPLISILTVSALLGAPFHRAVGHGPRRACRR